MLLDPFNVLQAETSIPFGGGRHALDPRTGRYQSPAAASTATPTLFLTKTVCAVLEALRPIPLPSDPLSKNPLTPPPRPLKE